MKVGDLVKSLNGILASGATMRGMLIRQTTSFKDMCTHTSFEEFQDQSNWDSEGIDWLVHWFEHPSNELTLEYSEYLVMISEP